MACIYCNEFAKELDHFIPISSRRIRMMGNLHRSGHPKHNTVPSCADCNKALNNVLIFTIEERAKHILKKRLKQFSKEMNSYEWSEEEILKEDFRMQQMLRFKLQERDRAVRRLNCLRLVASGERFASESALAK